MATPLYIHMTGWDRFQHYRDRTPPWIKNYVDLLANDDYLNLSGHRRSILHGLWLEYAMSHRRLRHDTATISSRLHLRVTVADLETLKQAGFIEVSASTPLAPEPAAASDTRARGETEAETDKKTPKPPFRKKQKTDVEKITAMIRNGVITNHVDLTAELSAAGINGDQEQHLRSLLPVDQPVLAVNDTHAEDEDRWAAVLAAGEPEHE